MKLRIFATVCAVAGFVAVFVTLHSGAAPVPTEPGMMPYTPTWLALELEGSYHQDFSGDNPYSVHYVAKPPNTVIIFVSYTSEAPAETVDDGIDAAKQLVKQTAFHHGWSWVKVEVSSKTVTKLLKK